MPPDTGIGFVPVDAGLHSGRQKEVRCFNVRHLAFVLWCFSARAPAVFTFQVRELRNPGRILAYIAFLTVVHGESIALPLKKKNDVPEVPLDCKHPFLEPGDFTASRFSAISGSF